MNTNGNKTDKNPGFRKARLQYTIKRIDKDSPTFLKEFFDDKNLTQGYAAFSSMETKIGGLDGDIKQQISANGFNRLNDNLGYTMEINLWGQTQNGCFREIVAERNGDHFLVQTWNLDLNEQAGADASWLRVYTRKARTFPFSKGDKTLFKPDELHTMEIIVPEMRITFYLTTGAKP